VQRLAYLLRYQFTITLNICFFCQCWRINSLRGRTPQPVSNHSNNGLSKMSPILSNMYYLKPYSLVALSSYVTDILQPLYQVAMFQISPSHTRGDFRCHVKRLQAFNFICYSLLSSPVLNGDIVSHFARRHSLFPSLSKL
jgi:hypothetical protein